MITYVYIMATLLVVLGVTSAHAELTIYQVENNPPGGDSGHEWLTLINTGAKDTFSGYHVMTTNGRIAAYDIPTIPELDTCKYYKFTFPKQAIDNQDDTVKLLHNGVTVYQTPVIKDTKNNDRFWTNPDVAAICSDTSTSTTTSPTDPTTPATTDSALEDRITALETKITSLEQMILYILDILNGLLGEN